MKLLTVIVCCFLMGCAGAPKLTDKDIKDSKIFCGFFNTPWSLKPEKIVYISNDQNVIKDGAVEIKGDCEIKWENNAIPTKEKKETK